MSRPPNCILLRKLGQGSYGEVFLAKHRGSDELIAVKCVPKVKLSRRGEDNLVSEISILRNLSHPHIVRLIDFTWDTGRVYLFMEYCAGGDLSQFIQAKRRLSEVLVRRFLRQLALALHHLHHRNIMHMDLKPQNILLTSTSHPVLKVTDFGFAKCAENTVQLNELRGTLLYMAPEIYLHGVYHPSCDLWSVGVLLYECLFGSPPYASTDLASFKQKLLNNEPIEFPSCVRISANCASLLRRLLRQNPNERLNHEEFFAHPFVDLKHAPSPESLEQAIYHLERACLSEASGELKVAYGEYTRGLSHLVSAIEYEASSKLRGELTQLAMQYFSQAERVKTLLKSLEHDEMPFTKPASDSYALEAAVQPVKIRSVASTASRRTKPPPRPPSLFQNSHTEPSTSLDDRPPATGTDSSPTGWIESLKKLFFSQMSTVPKSSHHRAEPLNTKTDPSTVNLKHSAVASVCPSEMPLPRPKSPKISECSISDSHTRPNGRERVPLPSSSVPTQHDFSPSSDGLQLMRRPISNIVMTSDENRNKTASTTCSSPGIAYDRSGSVSQTSDESNPVEPGDTAVPNTADKMKRLHRLSVSFGPSRSLEAEIERVPPTYEQQMALLTDMERLLELKSMCSDSDSHILEVLRILEEFYTLLRTHQVQQAVQYLEPQFTKCLQIVKEDVKDERRQTFLKELKLMLDLVESSKKHSPTLSESTQPVTSDQLPSIPEEIGTEVIADANTSECHVS